MPQVSPTKYLVRAGWDDVPHLSERAKADLIASTPPHEIEARRYGVPALGAGAVWPIPLSEILEEPFAVPDWWPRAYALDVGWNVTAALWGAWDPADNSLHVYSEYYGGKKEPIVHAAAIKSRGAWIKGAIDPAARGRTQIDGRQLMTEYRAQGLSVIPADNAVEAGVYAVWEALSLGRIRINKHLRNFQQEYRNYRRNGDVESASYGKIVKKNDHLMDCLAPGTLVCTDRGKVPIEALVGTEGRVLTVGGVYAPYRDCRVYGRGRRIVELRFDDGQVVRATPDHLFLTPSGWVPAIEMKGKLAHNAVPEAIRSASWGRSFCLKPARSLTGAVSTCAGIISSVTDAAFTALYGSIATALSRLAGMSTTSTATAATISPATSPSCGLAITCRSIMPGMTGASLTLPTRLRGTGTDRRKGSSGTGFTMSATAPIRCTAGSASTARSAGSSLTGWLRTEPGSAPTAARQRHARHPGWMTKIGNALSAVLCSASTGMRRGGPVRRGAHPRCVAVRDAGRSDVYCLSVPSTEAFAVEGGVIVHNCLRYLWMSGRKIARVRPIERDPLSAAAATTHDNRAGY